ncbi:MAG: hypothetical protein LBG18_01660 [Mediterranea sp.]|jgi:hypothetical protein|nr:hypothetical protein [Mediterranea sp.]
MDGLNQVERMKRISEAGKFAAIDNGIESLLRQAQAVAGFIRYYNPKGEIDGYFDQFLQDLDAIRKQGVENFVPDGNMEPAQALLFTFLRQLHEIAERFNRRWDDSAFRYCFDVLGLKPLPPEKHKICLQFAKNTAGAVNLHKGLGFRLKADPNSPVYHLTDDVIVENAAIEDVRSVYFGRQKNIFPATGLGFVTSLRVKNLLNSNIQENVLFGNGSGGEDAHPLGFMIVSPILLLREGKRTVRLVFEPENSSDTKNYLNEIVRRLSVANSCSMETSEYLLFHRIFYIRFSTADGWEVVENYTVKRENACLSLKFTLPEEFPSTAACNEETHQFRSDIPALMVYLNFDAWLYPYSWLKQFPIKKIRITTAVKGVNDVIVYNDLGKIDCSKPFVPFGVNTEKGAWMAVGNYEMAIKNTQSLDVHIQWGQLPAHAQGLKGHYAGYGGEIDNTSFRVKARYLSDYQWKDCGEYPLFGTVPDASLTTETTFQGINLKKMPAVRLPEEQYEYTIHAKTGFAGFILTSPDIGFGEKRYRTLFSDHIVSKTLAKKIPFFKKEKPEPGAPISPLIERITINYIAEETIDMQRRSSGQTTFCHISPFGNRQVYPATDNQVITPVYATGVDASLLILLSGVKKGGVLSLYFDFNRYNREITSEQTPQVKWYLGNGYLWETIPDGCITEDKTASFLMDGFVKICLPDTIGDNLFDEKGRIWLCVGVEKNEGVIPSIRKIYLNTGEAETEYSSAGQFGQLSGREWEPEESVAALTGCVSVASYHGRNDESREERLLRLSEYASHRGKAVTARDYERMTLQAFSNIAKVKCLMMDKNTIMLAVIPQRSGHSGAEQREPMASSRLLLKIEQYFTGRTPAQVHFVNAVNPLYEKVMVRCRVSFKKHYSSELYRTCLTDLLDDRIAPWQKTFGLPSFGSFLDMEAIRQAILQEEYIDDMQHLSLVVISEYSENNYMLYEYGRNHSRVSPSTPCSVFVPAREHLIEADDTTGFGISEMVIDESLIIS